MEVVLPNVTIKQLDGSNEPVGIAEIEYWQQKKKVVSLEIE